MPCLAETSEKSITILAYFPVTLYLILVSNLSVAKQMGILEYLNLYDQESVQECNPWRIAKLTDWKAFGI